MKKFLFFTAALVAGLLTSCSNDNEVNPNGGNAIEGDGYISLTLNLPTEPSTRGLNDNFDDGLAAEYAVTNSTLIFFTKSGDDYLYNATYTPALTFNTVGTTTDQITSVAKIVQKVSDNKQDLYLLVVLNAPSTLDLSASALNGKKYTDVAAMTTNATAAITQGSMMMANAPLAKAQGGSVEPSSSDLLELVPIDKSRIYATEAEARSNPASEVYVERIACKVTVQYKEGTATASKIGDEAITYKLVGWYLDNTNPNASLVRRTEGYNDFYKYYSDHANVAAANKYRMVGNVEVGKNFNGTETYYRTYWAKDANYSDTGVGTLATSTNYSANAKDKFGIENPQYCFENTFDVAHQIYKETTRVVLGVQFNDGTAFYTVDGDKATIYSATGLETKIKAAIMNIPEVNTWLTTTGHITGTFGADNITVTTATTGTTTTVTGIEFISTASCTINTAPSAADYSAWVTAVNAALPNIVCYADGMAYYDVRIQHFGEEHTPWLASEHATGAAYADEGTAPVSRYLGRYGVLRNNWYDLDISSVKYVGSATVPDITGDETTDDNVDAYIAVKINILSWAKRTQRPVLE